MSLAKTTVTSWVEEHAEALYTIAFGRLKDAETAKDLVQDTNTILLRDKVLPRHG
jgi:DNA-directed RNA polymerase specialized sigma24 family protein